jgi:adenosine deaminase
MPKVELHVHLEGSIRPETVLKLAKRNNVDLPASTVEGLSHWYTFRDFPHFVSVYVSVSQCIKSAEDIEFVAREFLQGQAAQNVLHSEITYTASTIEKYAGIPWELQFAALGRARAYGEKELGVSCGFIIDIVRGDPPERGLEVARWAVEGRESGVCALGIAGEEKLGSSDYREAYALARSERLPIAAHAGETCGPESVRAICELTDPERIGHGVRILEDPKLTREFVRSQKPLEVCPTSNVRLGVFASLEEHPLARMLDEGLYVTLNSDDPPMFGTTITDEFIRCSETFDLGSDILWTLTQNAARASFLPEDQKRSLQQRLREQFRELEAVSSTT